MKLVVLILLWVVLSASAAVASGPDSKSALNPPVPNSALSLKKITVVETNNLFFTDRYKYLYLPHSPSDPQMRKLKEYVLKRIQLSSRKEPEIFNQLLEWTCLRWQHDPLHEPPPGSSSYDILQLAAAGQKFRCQEYAQVFQDILTAFGYVSRMLQLRKPDAAYQTLGAGHVAIEVFSNALDKWVFMDPQWCIFPTSSDHPLSFYEFYEKKRDAKLDQVAFGMSTKILQRDSIANPEQYATQYRDFLTQYCGYEGIIANRFGGTVFLFLPLDAKEQYFTFQGVPVNRRVFTNTSNNLYFRVNSTVVLFDYDKEVNWSELFQKYDIKNPDDYMESMPKFAAKPDFDLQFHNCMPWFDHYEVKVDNGDWKKVKGERYTWHLVEGENEIKVRSVNTAGIAGVETFAKMHYGAIVGTH